jgi:hypothetical protein
MDLLAVIVNVNDDCVVLTVLRESDDEIDTDCLPWPLGYIMRLKC